MKRHYIILLFLLIYGGFVSAQESILISKEDILSTIKENNLSIRLSQEEVLKARADYRQTNSVFLPSVTASHTGIVTTNPLMAFGSKLNQEILTQADFNPDLLNDPEETRNFATIFEVQQPLINVDGFYQRKAARLGMKAREMQAMRTRDHILLESEKTYMQLQLAYKAVEVLEKARESALENQRLARNSYEQGLLQKADLLAVEVRVNEVANQLREARSQVKNISDYLGLLMNSDTEALFQPTDSLYVTPSAISDQNLPKTRADLQAMEMVSQAMEMTNRANKMAFLPRLNAFGNYQLYDDRILQGAAQGYLVGASLSWDLFQGYKNLGKAQKSKADFQKSQLELEQYISQSEVELKKAERWLEDTGQRLKLSSLALEQSAESLRIRTNRYREGLERTTDLLLAETQYAQKQLEYYQTVYEYNYAQSYLRFLTKE